MKKKLYLLLMIHLMVLEIMCKVMIKRKLEELQDNLDQEEYL